MKFWEAMRAIDEGKKVRPISDFWTFSEYLDKSNLFSWFESPKAAHYLLDEWEMYEEPEKTFSFAEVVRGIQCGKKFKRKHDPDQLYISSLYESIPIGLTAFSDWVEVK